MKNLLNILLIFSFVIIGKNTNGQAEKKSYYAQRLSDVDNIKLDGILDDAAWNTAEVASGFIQTEPVFQEPISQQSDVRILYDDGGIYVGAMLYDTEPQNILKEFSPRDQRNNVDWFGVVFDTYRDGLNGFSFNVTASGVQLDSRYAGGNEDRNWDGIWDSKVQMLDNGWSVEMYIPYLSLRFGDVELQEWNLQFIREIRRKRELTYWNPVDPAIEGFVNQFGHLDGIQDIKSPVRLSIIPFLTGYVNTAKAGGENVPTDATLAYTGGLDLKYGINDAFTLDMTVIPDFGQVLSDQQVLNLSPFEVRFDENRQFFTEGLELFDKGNVFFSRRVGGTPFAFFAPFAELQANESVVSNPQIAQLYNATKISGRTAKGTGIGFFNAVEGKEFATIENLLTGDTRQVETNPLTNYNVLVVDQNLANNSVISLINTNVTRIGDAYDANVTGGFFNLRNKKQSYNLSGSATVSNQFFESETITGHQYNVSFGKISGNWQWGLDYNEESDDFDPNDLGLLFSPNERSFGGSLGYTDFKPKNEKLQRWSVGVSQNYNRLFSPNVFTNYGIGLNAFVLWKSRNALGGNLFYEPVESRDYFEPRTADFSQFYLFPKSYSASSFFSSDYRKKLAIDVNVFYRVFDEPGRTFSNIVVSPRIRLSNKFSIFPSTTVSKSRNDVGFPGSSSQLPEISGLETGDILFGRRDRDILENSIQLQYIFNNLMSFSTRVRHYWDKVGYSGFQKLDVDGTLIELDYDGNDTSGDPAFDTNFNFFTVDMVYTWRFARGSDLIFVWKNQISGSDQDIASDYFTNVNGLSTLAQTNSISLKVVYFLDYNSVVRRRK